MGYRIYITDDLDASINNVRGSLSKAQYIKLAILEKLDRTSCKGGGAS